MLCDNCAWKRRHTGSSSSARSSEFCNGFQSRCRDSRARVGPTRRRGCGSKVDDVKYPLHPSICLFCWRSGKNDVAIAQPIQSHRSSDMESSINVGRLSICVPCSFLVAWKGCVYLTSHAMSFVVWNHVLHCLGIRGVLNILVFCCCIF